jgi:prepilin-type N-terminal cleavage/methylation domain-containing protein/prepilin-type processing-associated H-X9-DG protein
MRRTGTHTGFTIIELMVVIAVLAILAAMVAAVVKHVREEGRKAVCQNNLRQFGVAMGEFARKPFNHMRYPQMAWTMDQGYWFEQIYPYYQNVDIGVCPSDSKPFPMSRGTNMKITGPNDPWFDPEASYLPTRAAWANAYLSYRGSCDGYRTGGYGPRVWEYRDPAKSMLLNEAWDNVRYGTRQCSRAQDIWQGFPNAVEWERNWFGLTRHSGGTNFLFMDGGVRWIDVYSGPSSVTFGL